jgi:hypothetical protein
MKLALGLALALTCGCAAARPRPAAKQAEKKVPKKEQPLVETQTFGPSRVIYWR